MTLRYAHVGDRETEAAAERIGMNIARTLDDTRGCGGESADMQRTFRSSRSTTL